MPPGPDWLTYPRRLPPLLCRNSRDMSCAAQELLTLAPRVRSPHYSFRVQLDLVGDLGGYVQYSGNRAIVFFSMTNSNFYSFALDYTGSTYGERSLRRHE